MSDKSKVTKPVEKTDQEKVRLNKNNCDHIGYYVGHGFNTIAMTDGSIIAVSALNCMMCGRVFYPSATVVPSPINMDKKKTIS